MADQAVDYIVVGGGLTGCLIASRLSQSDKKPRVVLFEAGPDPSGNQAAASFLSGLSLIGGEYDYVYPSEPVADTANRKHVLSAGKVLGGGSILNMGGWLRADASDYDDWSGLVGDKRWSYEGLKPWLRKTENFHDPGADTDQHGFEGPMHVVPISMSASARKYALREPVREAWIELGASPNLRKKNGSIRGLTEMYENSRDEMRQPSNTTYPLNAVEVFTDTVVHKVTFSGTDATGVELADGRKFTARMEVIICAGAYCTPQILMLSGIGPSDILVKQEIPIVHESSHVGQNLHDHFALFLAFLLRDPSLGYAFGSTSWQDPALFKGIPWDWVVSEPLPVEVVAKHDPKMQDRNLYEVASLYIPAGLQGIPVDGTHICTSTMLLLPTSRGWVSIRSNKSNDAPYIQPSYFSTPLDRDALIYGVRQTLRSMLATSSMKEIIESESPPSGEGLDLKPLTADSSDAEIEDRIRKTGTQHCHAGGTAAMGKVVDTEGRVLGVKGLRVADASIIPIPVGGHPQATLYPMAEQLASMIIQGL
jgi:choline dehydrogenase-like flavoprotein